LARRSFDEANTERSQVDSCNSPLMGHSALEIFIQKER